MTDTATQPTDERLIVAEQARKQAEARKLDAEANKAQAETLMAEAAVAETRATIRRVSAEADVAEHVAVINRLAREKAERDDAYAMAGDENHHVYRFGAAVDASTVKGCMTKLAAWSRLEPGCPMEIVFNSPGGSIINGFELFDFVRSLSKAGHEITTGALGYAASMAGILLQMGDKRWMGSQSWLMIHRAAFGAHGQTFEVEDEVAYVKRIEQRIVDLFLSRSKATVNGDKSKVVLTERMIRKNWDRRDWWLTPEEALKYGLIDEVR